MNNKVSLKRHMQYLLATALTAYACAATAGNDFDQKKVAMCVACHGADGVGKAIQYPDLQGKPVDYIVMQLRYFKSGIRKGAAMNMVAKSLSEEDMQMLAVFFNQVR